MEIKITKLKKIGSYSIPQPLEYNIKPLTLIYGKNEKGKTSLVEGLLSAFFPKRSLKIFNQIREDLDTKLEITLKVDENQKIFRPNTKNNLEDLLPQGLSRFLFTKAAEVEFASGENHNKVLTSILSEKNIISTIKKSLDKNDLDQKRGVQFYNNEVIAHRNDSTILRQWNDYKSSLEQIKNLREQYSNQEVGKVIELQSQQNKNSEKFENEIQAFEKEKVNLENEKNSLEQTYNDEKYTTLHNIQTQFSSAKRLQEEIDTLQNDVTTLEEKQNQLNKIEYYKEAYASQSKTKTSFSFYLIAFSILSLTGFTAFLFKSLFLLIGGFTAALIFFIVPLLKNSNSKNSSQDFQTLAREFKNDFNQDLTAATLSTLENQYNEQNTHLNLLNENLQNKTEDSRNLLYQIDTDLTQNFSLQIANTDFPTVYQEIEEKLSDLAQDFQNARQTISDLTSKIQARTEEISQLKEDKNNDFQQYEGKIHDERLKHEKLKAAFQTALGINDNLDWETLMKSLNEREEALIKERNNLIAKVIAAQNLREIISKMEENENTMIQEQLNSPIFTEKLKFFTDDFYTNLSFNNNGEFLVTTKNNEIWNFQNLSSGAQEQILLAIRFGVVENKFDGHVFFVLDDAFQFSDYERREKLVKKSVDLVKDGWQILYLSMDDHIAKLFDKYGSELKDSYQKYVL